MEGFIHFRLQKNPLHNYLYEQNIIDFYNNAATNMDDSRLYLQKGITPLSRSKPNDIRYGNEVTIQLTRKLIDIL